MTRVEIFDEDGQVLNVSAAGNIGIDQGVPGTIANAWPVRISDPGTGSPAGVSGGALAVFTGGINPQTSLNAVTTNVNGSTIDFGSSKNAISFVVSTTGSPTGGTVTLQVSHDGTNWFATTTTATVGATVSSGSLGNVAYRYARCVLSGLTGGTSPTVTATIMASG